MYLAGSAFITMLRTVDRQIEKLATEHPDSIVGITTFDESLTFVGDGS